ncbi:ABC transporter substrate-binding protein [Cohnella luojiensis]|uniref:Extracellular solute-binding protein n=1 Tax=Cohnella luojiensis TaxID=652876 RepID=A0A4Y8LPS2_9BACL|nr:extracellular solute-binding protein [Cohnella luojiensis]TFE23326.1 extracellular solute-binding protein [Cohnella luojiensis]
MLKKLSKGVMVTVAATLLLAGCSSNDNKNANANNGIDGEEVTLKVLNYHVGEDYAASFFKKMFDEFPSSELGKGVKFDMQEIPTTDAYAQKIKVLFATGDIPDIILTSGNNILDLAVKSGKIADLTPYFDADPEWKSSFDPGALERNSIDGKIYAVPNQKEIAMIYYNKALFKKAGIAEPETSFASWEEFFAACEKLKAAGITPLSLDTNDFAWLSSMFLGAMIGTANEEGNKFMNALHPTNFNNLEVVDALKNLKTMLTQYSTQDAIGGKYDPMAAHFLMGEVAMISNGPWMVPDFSNKEKAVEGLSDQIGVMLFPEDGMVNVPGAGDMVSAGDKATTDAAVNFLKYQTSLDNQITSLKMTGIIPVSSKAVVPEEFNKENPLVGRMLELTTKAKYQFGENQANWYQNTLDTLSRLLPELAFDKITPEDFAKKLEEVAKKNE